MAQWILKANRNVVPRRSIRPLHVGEIHSTFGIKKREAFDALIEWRHAISTTPTNVSTSFPNDDGEAVDTSCLLYHDDIEVPR